MADGRRGFKADFNEGNRHKKNTYGITFVNFFKTSLFGYLRHFNLWFNYLRLTARHDLKFFPIYLFLILITYLYAEYRYTRKILRKLKNYFFKKKGYIKLMKILGISMGFNSSAAIMLMVK